MRKPSSGHHLPPLSSYSFVTQTRELSPLKKGDVSVRLTSLYLLVRNQLYQGKLIFFHFQNNLILTSKDEEVSRTDTSPFTINVSFPCTDLLRLIIFKMDTFPIDNEINELVNTTFLLLRAIDHSLNNC